MYSENCADIKEVRNKLVEHHKTLWSIRAQSFPKLSIFALNIARLRMEKHARDQLIAQVIILENAI